MSEVDVLWLEKIKAEIYANSGRDLYDILYAALMGKKTSFRVFLKMASEGYGISPSEGFSYALDQDWDVPEDFDEVSFFLGEFETSSIPPEHFVQLMQIISNGYLQSFPEDSQSVEQYIEILRKRYSDPEVCK